MGIRDTAQYGEPWGGLDEHSHLVGLLGGAFLVIFPERVQEG